ncbi:MAG: hypothetical protein AB1351_02625 [Thermoproteota archaeon]
MANTKTLMKVTFYVEKIDELQLVKALKKIGIQSLQIQEGKFHTTKQIDFKPSDDSKEPSLYGSDGRSGQLKINSKNAIADPEKIVLKRRRKKGRNKAD